MYNKTIKQQDSTLSSVAAITAGNKKRQIMYIIGWDVISVTPNGIADKSDLNAKSLQDVKLSIQGENTDIELKEQSVKGLKIPSDNNKSLTEEEKNNSANTAKREKYKNCVAPLRVIVKLQLEVVDFPTWRNQLEIAIKNKSNLIIALADSINNPIIKADAIKAIKEKKLSTLYDVAFNTNEFVSFDLNPDYIALEITSGNSQELSDPKIVAYSEESRYLIPGAQEAGKPRVTDDGNNITKALSDLVKDAKEAANKNLDEKIKKVKDKINEKAKIATTAEGVSEIKVKNNKKNKNKKSKTPGEDSVELSNTMGAIKLAKWYENASQKVQYGISPFNIDYKGYKPNILGKFFASDSNVPVETWKKNLGIIGEELIKIASSVAALKAFQIAVESSGVKEELDKATEKLRKQENSGQAINKGAILGNEGYNDQANGAQIANDISRFTRF